MPPDTILFTIDGQDRGARFGLPGSEAVLGRDPLADMMLTDPRVGARHAVMGLHEDVLSVRDLGGAGGTRVNGRVIAGDAAVPLRAGDRIGLGATELLVLWSPDGASVAPPVDGADAPALREPEAAPEPEPIGLRPTRPPARAVSAPVALAFTGFVGGLLALVATTMPALERPGDSESLWTIDPPGLRTFAVLVALGALAASAAWLGVELAPGSRPGRGPLAVAAAGAGGLVMGIPLMVAASPTPGATAGGGLGAMAAGGLTLIACAVARMRVAAGPRRGPDPAGVGRWTRMMGAAGVGGAITATVTPLEWVRGTGGLDGALGVGRWLVPLALTGAAACLVAAAVGPLIEARATTGAAVTAVGLNGVTLAFVTASAIALTDGPAGPGLTLAVAGALAGAVLVTVATLSLVCEPGAASPRGSRLG